MDFSPSPRAADPTAGGRSFQTTTEAYAAFLPVVQHLGSRCTRLVRADP